MHLPLNQILLGDCLELLKNLPDASIDSVVVDPPYGLGAKDPSPIDIFMYVLGGGLDTRGDFMGNDWQIPSVAVWREVYRILKPGGHVVSFGGTRTFDLISIGLRMAGFRSRDTIAREYPNLQWIQGQGMPKSKSLGAAIDKKLGNERKVVGQYQFPPGHALHGKDLTAWLERTDESDENRSVYSKGLGGKRDVTAPASEEAAQFEGWGSGLKPSWEPILVFRKPFKGSLTENVMTHGTGGLNIDATRVKHASKEDFESHKKGVESIREKGGSRDRSWKNASDLAGASEVTIAGRWPSNVVLEHSPLCQKVGVKKVKAITGGTAPPVRQRAVYDKAGGYNKRGNEQPAVKAYGEDDGLESVEAWECAEGCPVLALDEQSGDRPSTLTGRADPNASHEHPGTEMNPNSTFLGERTHLSRVYADQGGACRFFTQLEAEGGVPFKYVAKANRKEAGSGEFEVEHVTLKPLSLIRWLVRLVTPKGGVVLDPYCGSGTTCHAALLEEMSYVGIERDPENHAEALKRLEVAQRLLDERREAQELFDFAMGRT